MRFQRAISTIPWKQSPLDEWSIVGMNHYYQSKEYATNGRFLYVAMVKDDRVIRAEGADSDDVWNDLAVKSILVNLPKVFRLDFDPLESDDPHIKTIFEDNYGGLIWCAMRSGRLADQFFNEKIAIMMTTLRTLPPDSRCWLRGDRTNILGALPRTVLGNSENAELWAEALLRIVSTLQGRWTIQKPK